MCIDYELPLALHFKGVFSEVFRPVLKPNEDLRMIIKWILWEPSIGFGMVSHKGKRQFEFLRATKR